MIDLKDKYVMGRVLYKVRMELEEVDLAFRFKINRGITENNTLFSIVFKGRNPVILPVGTISYCSLQSENERSFAERLISMIKGKVEIEAFRLVRRISNKTYTHPNKERTDEHRKRGLS